MLAVTWKHGGSCHVAIYSITSFLLCMNFFLGANSLRTWVFGEKAISRHCTSDDPQKLQAKHVKRFFSLTSVRRNKSKLFGSLRCCLRLHADVPEYHYIKEKNCMLEPTSISFLLDSLHGNDFLNEWPSRPSITCSYRKRFAMVSLLWFPFIQIARDQTQNICMQGMCSTGGSVMLLSCLFKSPSCPHVSV